MVFFFGKAVELRLKMVFPVTSVVHLSRHASVITMYFQIDLCSTRGSSDVPSRLHYSSGSFLHVFTLEDV